MRSQLELQFDNNLRKTKQLISRVVHTHMPFREQVLSKVELDALLANDENADVRQKRR